MAGEKQESPWPVPKFHFKATFGDKGEIAFQEISGLDTEHDIIEYHAGDSPVFGKITMPGSRKAPEVKSFQASTLTKRTARSLQVKIEAN
jgi:hypothetical protein